MYSRVSVHLTAWRFAAAAVANVKKLAAWLEYAQAQERIIGLNPVRRQHITITNFSRFVLSVRYHQQQCVLTN